MQMVRWQTGPWSSPSSKPGRMCRSELSCPVTFVQSVTVCCCCVSVGLLFFLSTVVRFIFVLFVTFFITITFISGLTFCSCVHCMYCTLKMKGRRAAGCLCVHPLSKHVSAAAAPTPLPPPPTSPPPLVLSYHPSSGISSCTTVNTEPRVQLFEHCQTRALSLLIFHSVVQSVPVCPTLSQSVPVSLSCGEQWNLIMFFSYFYWLLASLSPLLLW